MTENEVETPTQEITHDGPHLGKPGKDSIEANKELLLRNNFYRDNYRRIMYFTFLLIFIIIGQIGFIFFLHATRTEPTYYATTHTGTQIRLSPRNEPNLTTAALLDWVANAAVSSYSFNFVNWNEALTSVRAYYTPSGYQNFMAALKASNTLQDVRSKKLVVSAVITGTPVILQEGLVNGSYTWRIQLPMLLSYQSASEVIKQNITMTMLVTRVPTLESEKGVGIAQLIVAEGKAK